MDGPGLPFDQETFDCVVCADVLEHIKDPWGALADLFGLLRPGGEIVVSIPNIRNLGVMAELAAGDWAYQEAGILDRTHLRFFTRRSFRRALLGAGFEIRSENSIVDPTLQAAATRSGETYASSWPAADQRSDPRRRSGIGDGAVPLRGGPIFGRLPRGPEHGDVRALGPHSSALTLGPHPLGRISSHERSDLARTGRDSPGRTPGGSNGPTNPSPVVLHLHVDVG